jgi:hypothetical protein
LKFVSRLYVHFNVTKLTLSEKFCAGFKWNQSVSRTLTLYPIMGRKIIKIFPFTFSSCKQGRRFNSPIALFCDSNKMTFSTWTGWFLLKTIKSEVYRREIGLLSMWFSVKPAVKLAYELLSSQDFDGIGRGKGGQPPLFDTGLRHRLANTHRLPMACIPSTQESAGMNSGRPPTTSASFVYMMLETGAWKNGIAGSVNFLPELYFQ